MGVLVGLAVGWTVGVREGRWLGMPLGSSEGLELGDFEGDSDGRALGLADGRTLGMSDGILVGEALGLADGMSLGDNDGLCDRVGAALADAVGITLGTSDAITDGLSDGAEVTGATVGLEDGRADTVGTADGALDGPSVMTDADSCPHLPQVRGQAASPLVRTPSSAEQYRAILLALFLIQPHFFFFLSTLGMPIRALLSLHVSEAYVHDSPHVAGHRTAANGWRYPTKGCAPSMPQYCRLARS